MPESIRTFIAIELADGQKRSLADLQTRLKREHAAVKIARSSSSNAIRWVAADNIHLTLKFLGNVDADKMPALQNAVADACTGTSPFVLKLDGVGAFPNLTRPNVVWVGIKGDIKMATRLAQKIDDACAALGFPREERAFSPHLTLGRVNRDADSRERQLIGEMIAKAEAHELGDFRVDHVSLMKSVLKPGGSVYSRLAEINLISNK